MKRLKSILILFVFIFPVHAAENLSITLDDQLPGRTYDGIGGLMSYAKLLYDYPEPQRGEILDFLFLPNYGASLQILKIQIGYDGSNTTSCWPCHWRDQQVLNYRRGYGWWLLKEAKKRNPDILLTALHWGYPAWAETVEQKAEFIFDFVRGAYEEHGILLNFIGGNQNESAIDQSVTIRLKQKLLASPVMKSVKVTAADEGSLSAKFKVIEALRNPTYADAVDIVGVHYKSRSGNDPIMNGIFDFGKPVWSTEDGGGMFNNNTHGYQWINQLMKLLVDVKITGVMRFLVTASAYDNMPWPDFALLKAKEPWSGNYVVGANLWATAHFTQFVKPGWKMFETDNPYIYANETDSGRWVAYKDPDRNDFSLIINTPNQFPTGGTNVRLNFPGDLAGKTLYVWRSNFTKYNKDRWFELAGTLLLPEGSVNINLEPKSVYTLTTTTGQRKGLVNSPATSVLEFPYLDDFESYEAEQQARYFVNVNSSFEIAPTGTGTPGQVLRQVVTTAPKLWHPNDENIGQPLTEIGDMRWTDYAVKIDALLENQGTLFLGGRFDGKSDDTGDYRMEGYYLSLDETGVWRLLRKDASNPEFTVLSVGKVNGFGLNLWASMTLAFNGNLITAYIGGNEVTSVIDDTYANGNVVIGTMHHDVTNFFVQTSQYVNAKFDNLLIDSEKSSLPSVLPAHKPFEVMICDHRNLKIHFPEPGLKDMAIYDQNGRQVAKRSFEYNTAIRLYEAGLYFISIGKYTEKIVLK